MSRPKIAILASGSGTTAEAFIVAGAAGKIEAQVGLVICSKKSAGIFDRVERLNSEYGLNIKCVHIGKENYPDSSDEENAILNMLSTEEFDLIALMGYMRKIGPNIVSKYGWRSNYTSPYQAMMLNTHPGLLPESAGMYGRNVQQYTLDSNLSFGGQTLHVVSEGYDEGPIIAEHRVPVAPGDTADTLFAKVQDTEKKYLSEDIDNFIKTRVEYLKGDKK
ncbi:MAG: formyltransferase family protein [Patescibacteria group bacterium]